MVVRHQLSIASSPCFPHFSAREVGRCRNLIGEAPRSDNQIPKVDFRFAMDELFLPYGEMARVRAALLIPNDVTMFTFSEAFAMGLPVLMPSPEWLYRMQKSVPYGYMVHRGPVLPGPQDEFPTPPFWGHKESFKALPQVISRLQASLFYPPCAIVTSRFSLYRPRINYPLKSGIHSN